MVSARTARLVSKYLDKYKAHSAIDEEARKRALELIEKLFEIDLEKLLKVLPAPIVAKLVNLRSACIRALEQIAKWSLSALSGIPAKIEVDSTWLNPKLIIEINYEELVKAELEKLVGDKIPAHVLEIIVKEREEPDTRSPQTSTPSSSSGENVEGYVVSVDSAGKVIDIKTKYTANVLDKVRKEKGIPESVEKERKVILVKPRGENNNQSNS